jgi:hypothetical protein
MISLQLGRAKAWLKGWDYRKHQTLRNTARRNMTNKPGQFDTSIERRATSASFKTGAFRTFGRMTGRHRQTR